MSRAHYNHLSPFCGPTDGCQVCGTYTKYLGSLELRDGTWRFVTKDNTTLRADGWLDMLRLVIQYCNNNDDVISYQ